MPRRFGIELRAVGVIFFVLLIVVTSGILAYRNFSHVIQTVAIASRPHMKLVQLEALRSNLSDAESSVRSYNLTHNENYLSSFYATVYAVDQILVSLRNGDSADHHLIDSLAGMVDEKYEVLGEILLLQNNEKVTDELKRIARKLDETTK